MKVALAQVRSETGHVQRNVDHHLAVLRRLEPGAADLVVFPELSLTNYDPEIAGTVAIEPTDERLDALQRHADAAQTVVAVGAPLRTSGNPLIGLLVFTPGQDPVVVGKRHLHADEVPFFTPFDGDVGVLELAARVGIAICYEVSVAEHTAAVMAASPALYLASVAKTPNGVTAAEATLAATAQRYGVPALMVNSVGTCEGKPAGGGSMALDRSGRVVSRLGGSDEGLLVYDTASGVGTPVPVGVTVR